MISLTKDKVLMGYVVDSDELQAEIEEEMNQQELDEEDIQDGGVSEEAEETEE